MRIGWKAAGSDRKIASLRYRVEAPVSALTARGHQVEIFDPANAGRYDAVVFAKAYSAADRALAASVRSRGGRVIFDLCDNHFHNPYDLPKYRQAREDLLDMLSMSQAVICATPALARVVREEAPWAADPMVIGDPVEKVRSAPPSLPAFEGQRLLWFGSHGSPNAPSGMPDILLISAQLEAASRSHPLELVVCSNDEGKYQRLIAPLPFATRYVEWTLDGFPGVLAAADGVVIPISRNPFTACKTHNRLTTALYAGACVIADRIEDYEEFAPFCTLDDWAGGLRALLEDPQGERRRAFQARDYIDKRWTAESLAPKWEAALGLTPFVAVEAPRVYAAPPEAAAEMAPAAALDALSGIAPRRSADHRRCQGALDGRGDAAVTGWVRIAAEPGRRLTVLLTSEGREVARAVADLPRPDLARAGMADAACGFSLPAPETEADLYEVVVEETGWRFDEPPFALRGDADGLKLSFRPRDEAPAPRNGAALDGRRRLEPGEARAAKDLQEQLLAELENLAALASQARDAAARLLIAAGDDASLARRVLAVLSGKPRPTPGRHPSRRPDTEDRPPLRLN